MLKLRRQGEGDRPGFVVPGGRSASGRGWARLGIVLLALGLAACRDVTAPQKEVFQLVAVNGIAIPTIAVEGSCQSIGLFDPYPIRPDSINVDGGGLTLEGGRYQLYYTWRGETDACTVTHAHWHRFSGGTYTANGDTFVFSEGQVDDPISGSAGASPGTPSGERLDATRILVRWGALRLQFNRS